MIGVVAWTRTGTSMGRFSAKGHGECHAAHGAAGRHRGAGFDPKRKMLLIIGGRMALCSAINAVFGADRKTRWLSPSKRRGYDALLQKTSSLNAESIFG